MVRTLTLFISARIIRILQARAIAESRELILSLHRAGKSPEEILAAYTARYRDCLAASQQPDRPFALNGQAAIGVLLREEAACRQ